MSSDLLRGRRGVMLWLGCVTAMVFLIVMVGGITRLTGSGLSMVDWRPLLGAIPPLNEAEWQRLFEVYQQYPQYQNTFPRMDLEDFKQIFFWEYLHRLLGRSLGLVFLLPFLLFWWQRCFSPRLTRRLLVAFFLGGLQGLLGWYMVMSGLIDMPRVSHLRLAAHLSLAFVIIIYLFWLMLDLGEAGNSPRQRGSLWALSWLTGIGVGVQIVYGALVAGMRAGLGYNTFPKMGDRWIAQAVGTMEPWWRNLVFSHATLQFIHRWLGVLVFFLVTWFWLLSRNEADERRRNGAHLLFAAMLLQFLLGVYTLVNVVPLVPAVMHQAGAGLLLLATVFVVHEQQART